MKDLFGADVPEPAPVALTSGGRPKRKPTPKRGHARPPGTGPAGETCGSCQHIARRQWAGTYMKCALNQAKWTRGPGSDVRARDPACEKWAHA